MTINQTALDQVVDNAINAKSIVGTSILIAKEGEVIYQRSAGLADREKNIEVTTDTIFRLASMTKPIVSAAIMRLIEENVLQLDAPITTWLPTFQPKLADGTTPIITIRQLLNHTSGLTYGFLTEDNEPYKSAGVSDGIDESVLSLEENLKRIAAVPLLFDPGSSWCYSIATDVLGAVVQAACNQSLSEIVAEYVTGPLGMTDTTFKVNTTQLHKLAQAYADSDEKGSPPRLMAPADKVLLEGCGFIHYAPGRITNSQAYPSGGSGMASTAKDYLKFLETIRRGGNQLLSAESVNLMTHDSVPHVEELAEGPGVGFGLGFCVIRNSQEAQTTKPAGTFEWAGVYGTSMFVDIKNKLSVVILTNTAVEGVAGSFPADIVKAIYASLT